MSDPQHTIRILHLEDSPRDAELIRDLLDAGGGAYEILRAANRKQFEAALQQPAFDLILCDFNLPDFSGLSALKLAKERYPETPVIIVSGAIDAEEAMECLRNGATDYLLKQRLERLPSAVERAVVEAEEHRQRRRAEAELTASESQLRAVWETALDGMRLTDAEGTVWRVNEAYCRLMRLPRSALEGQPMSAPYAEAKQTSALERHRRRFRERSISPYLETEVTLRDGARRHLEVSNTFMPMSGQPELSLSIFRDITARKQADDALRRSEARLQEAQRVARLGNWDWDITTNDLYWSDEIYSIFGLQPQFATTYPAFLERVHPLDRSRIMAALDAAVHTGAPYDLDHRIVLPDGRERTVHETGLVCRDETGRPRRMVGTVQDITEREAAAAQIRAQADLLNKARDAIILADLDNRVTFWNHGAERITGWPAAEVLGNTKEQLFGATAAIAAAREAILATGSWHGEISLIRKDGQPVVIDLRSTLIRDEAGQPKSRLHIGTDITEKKQLEEQALRAQRLESLGMLAAGITHDFNNILAPLVMATSLLEPLITDERGRNILSIIQKSANRGTGLVRQLLSFTSGVGGGTQLLQTRHLLSDVAELVASTFPKAIRFESTVPGDLWPVTANASQLHQVFLNLCINARDAMPQGGTLRLSAGNRQLTAEEANTIPDARPGAFLVVEVADTGTGIPPEIIEQIWEPFFTTKGPGKGTGLGLSTVRGLVYQHGGFITLQSRVHHGTVFTVFLPAAVTERDSSTAPHAPPTPPRGNGELILVVDDEEHVRDMVTLMLEQHGYRVLTAGDGTAALAAFTTHADEILLLLTDYQMPQLGGPELTAALHRIRPGLPVIAMSGAGSGAMMGMPHFASAFIPKPFALEILLSAVHAALHRPPSAPPA